MVQYLRLCVAFKKTTIPQRGLLSDIGCFCLTHKKGMDDFFLRKSKKIFALQKICVIVITGTLTFLGFLWLNEGLVFVLYL